MYYIFCNYNWTHIAPFHNKFYITTGLRYYTSYICSAVLLDKHYILATEPMAYLTYWWLIKMKKNRLNVATLATRYKHSCTQISTLYMLKIPVLIATSKIQCTCRCQVIKFTKKKKKDFQHFLHQKSFEIFCG